MTNWNILWINVKINFAIPSGAPTNTISKIISEFYRTFTRGLILWSSGGAVPLIEPIHVKLESATKVFTIYALLGFKIPCDSGELVMAPFKYFGLARGVDNKLLLELSAEQLLEQLPLFRISHVSYLYLVLRSEIFTNISSSNLNRAQYLIKSGLGIIKVDPNEFHRYGIKPIYEIDFTFDLKDAINNPGVQKLYGYVLYVIGLAISAILASYSRISFALRQVAAQTLLSLIIDLIKRKELINIVRGLSRLLSILVIEYYIHSPHVLESLRMIFSAEISHAIAHVPINRVVSQYNIDKIMDEISQFIIKTMSSKIIDNKGKIKIEPFREIINKIKDKLLIRGNEGLLGRTELIWSAFSRIFDKIQDFEDNKDKIAIVINLTEQSSLIDILLIENLITNYQSKFGDIPVIVLYTPQTFLNRLIIEDLVILRDGRVKPETLILPIDRPLLLRDIIKGHAKKLKGINKIIYIAQGPIDLISNIILGYRYMKKDVFVSLIGYTR